MLWEPAPNDNSLESSTPLGFRSEILPGDDSEDPDPCVRVFYPNETSNNYIQVLVSEVHVCQEKKVYVTGLDYWTEGKYACKSYT